MRTWPIAVLPLVLSGVAFAKTPDLLTPAVETVCDEYRGSAYGLCTAYCEAMDCDDPRAHASPRGCQAVRRAFMRRTGDELPCLEEPEPECVYDAVDDEIPLADLVVGENILSLFDNDDANPGPAVLISVSEAENVDPVIEDANAGTVSIDYSGFFDMFEYTACCGESCDTATVTVQGS